MTLYEAYSYLYDNRKKNPILRGRFLSAFNYWRNGTGPNEDAQRKHLLQAGFTWTYTTEDVWIKPEKFGNFKTITISLVELDHEFKPPLTENGWDAQTWCYTPIGDHFRLHIAGPEADLKRIQNKFGIPKKMK